jgi:hypothetical protein
MQTTKIETPAPTKADPVTRPEEASTKTTGTSIRDAALIDHAELRRRSHAPED